MKRAMVIFESMFGNTREIADAVAEGLSSSLSTVILEVGAAPAVLPDDVDLIVVGGPTHAFGLSRPGTRENAIRQAGGRVVSEGYRVARVARGARANQRERGGRYVRYADRQATCPGLGRPGGGEASPETRIPGRRGLGELLRDGNDWTAR